jgi:hypothetical protein
MYDKYRDIGDEAAKLKVSDSVSGTAMQIDLSGGCRLESLMDGWCLDV